MIDMKGFPEDIWYSANYVMAKAPEYDEQLHDAVANAILAERERCAILAENELLLTREGKVCIIDENAVPSRISARIRGGVEAKRGVTPSPLRDVRLEALEEQVAMIRSHLVL